jgi:hypothetical protein
VQDEVLARPYRGAVKLLQLMVRADTSGQIA